MQREQYQERAKGKSMEGPPAEVEKAMEGSRRKAFLGLQIKYTLVPLFVLYAVVFAVLTGLFLYNWFMEAAKAEWKVSFLEQMSALPLGLAFFVPVIGGQVILTRGFIRQERNELAMKRVLLSEETRGLIRWLYSFLVTLSAFLAHFVMLCMLLLLENCLVPDTAYGAAELYPVFYTVPYLYRLYPVANSMAVFVFPVVVTAVSVMAPQLEGVLRNRDWNNFIWAFFIMMSFLFYLFGEDRTALLESLVCMVIFGMYGLGKVLFFYRRRRKDDRAELK